MREIHFIVPGLPQISESWSLELPAIPALDRFFSRCHRTRQQITGYESVLCDLFGIEVNKHDNLPLGAIRRFGITAIEGRGNYLCADPVSLQAGQRQIILQDSTHLAIQQHEADQLVKLFNDFYAGEGWRLSADSPQYWHLTGTFQHAVSLPPPGNIINQRINQYLSASSQPSYWRQIMNEIQMLFHNAEVNQLRESEGRPVINGLWLYGEGNLPEMAKNQWSCIRSNHPVAAGLAKLAKSDFDRLPESFNDLITDNASIDASSNACLISSDLLHSAVVHDDYESWESAIKWLNNQWFSPTLHHMKQRGLKRIVVHDCAGYRYDMRPSDLWHFWKPVKGISFWGIKIN